MNHGSVSRLGMAVGLVVAVTSLAAGCLVDFGGRGTNDNVPPGCGNDVLEAGELCDGSDLGGQTCETALGMEFGDLQCTAVCLLDLSGCHNCGNGVIDDGESCDDFNHTSGDGCSDRCQMETGWTCMGTPSICSTVCGDGLVIVGIEGCDDGNLTSGDGCSPACSVDPGWVCAGEPSDCNETCGNGVVDSGEGCDDGNLTPADGCSPNCAVEAGWQCGGEPSVCDGVCGDGLVLGNEACDDGNTDSGDGCLADCSVENGWTCDYSAEPPVGCTPVCGDGLLLGGEACDDANLVSGDGCAADCTVEPYFACDGDPSTCVCVVYVDRDVVGGVHNGASWADAFERVSDALQPAASRSPCEIWVAEGVYYTYRFSTNDRLEPESNVALYGGFAGTETSRGQRDFATRVTVLSGEQENNPSNRVRRVLATDGAQGTTIDGFTISDAFNQTTEGGGIRIQGGGDVTLSNCTFLDNFAEEGAAISLRDGAAMVRDCIFWNNAADQSGGAISVVNNGSMVLERCLFLENSALDRGGAINVDNADLLTVDHCRFLQNTAQWYGGAIRLAGTGADITSSVFWQNHSNQGPGGVSFYQTWPISNVINCTFHDNTVSGTADGASAYVTSADVNFRNTILWGSDPDQVHLGPGGNVTFSYCDVFGGASGSGVFDSDPDFVAPLTGDLRLLLSSPCIDVADGDVAPATDLGGNPRVDIPTVPNGGVGTPAYVDIGAHEYQP